MKKIYSIIKKFITEYTSGLPLFLWSIAGIGIAVFVFLFRNNEHINFEKLKYIILISAVWVIASDILKKRAVLNKTFHFIIDSVVYISLYVGIVYFGGGIAGGFSFIFFLGAVSAPFFGSNLQTTLFLIFLGISRFFIYRLTATNIDLYHDFIISLEVLFYFIMAGVIRFSLLEMNKAETEKRLLAEKFIKECQEAVKIKTQELEEAQGMMKDINIELEKKVIERPTEIFNLKENLEKTVEKRTNELQTKLEELKRFHDLTVGREMKMIELKREIEKLKLK
jgi:hypothetical protein